MKKPDKVFRELGQLYEFGKNLKSFQVNQNVPKKRAQNQSKPQNAKSEVCNSLGAKEYMK